MSGHHTAAVHCGSPSPQFHEWESTKVFCHGFAGLSVERNVPMKSPEFTCLGHSWALWIFPGGYSRPNDGYVSPQYIDGYVSILLVSRSNKKKNNVDYGLTLLEIEVGKLARQARQSSSLDNEFRFFPASRKHSGTINFMKRSELMKSLAEGTLIIEVHMKLSEPTDACLPPFVPENPYACKTLQRLFMDEESADIVFEVGGQRGKNNEEKVAKIEPTVFHAHRLILRKSPTTLAELCGSAGDQITPIQVNDVSPDIFSHLLRYIYGGKVSEEDMKTQAKEIIEAADRFGIAILKLEAEACFLEATVFTLENVVDHLLYADSKNCALLKETAVDFMLENKVEVLKKVSMQDIPGGLFTDLLAAVARGEEATSGNVASSEDKYSTMRVSALRRKCHENGLNVDGSREVLIAALKERSSEV